MPIVDMPALHERIVVHICATIGPMLERRATEELYAVALTTDSDVITVRLATHTEEALRLLVDVDDEYADDYRWWPDEWVVADDDGTPEQGVESTAQISRDMFDTHLSLGEDAKAHGEWCERARATLEDALGDRRVRASIAAVNPAWHPVLFVTDTDGDQRPTVRSIDLLNTGHPNPDLVASARSFFQQT
ncbi:uncharacterized protein DUF4303 [Micromonospora sp. M71_S20]|uniref:DUF4303 domain-containing protein n=1 Tax=Micromonospora sp. M71_S20 TaxID=592872 RepID=UPI000F1C5530|nr:DUF4303 domain-containing protein [Micromonospora sp. M71_S20]RLK23076.1 uncharacterized protein DUF4303 [Micromonospora sp. M71_S20]